MKHGVREQRCHFVNTPQDAAQKLEEHKTMLEARSRLPIFAAREQLLSAVDRNQVVVVSSRCSLLM